jgi:hypothetical protein
MKKKCATEKTSPKSTNTMGDITYLMNKNGTSTEINQTID